MGTEELSNSNKKTNGDVKQFDFKMKSQPNVKTESPFTNSDHDYNGGREVLPAAAFQSSSENINVKNVRVKSELECTNSTYANHSFPTTHKFTNTVCASCPTKCEEDVFPSRNRKRKSCYDILIKQEVNDVENHENCSLQNDSLTVDPDMIMENGCTNSACNSHTQCLQTFKCNKCSLIFTEKQMFSIHYKQCISEVPLASPANNTNGLISHCSSYESSRDLKEFIQKIREHPCLYNAHNTDYINTQLKNSLWTELASEFNFADGINAKTAWNKLVNNFCECLKQHPQMKGRHFKYQKQMEFLFPYVNSAIHTEQREPVMVVSDDMDADDVDIVQQHMSPAKRQRVMSSSVNESLNMSIRNSREGKTRKRSSQPLDMFFLSMCETTKNLPSHLQILVKRKVFQAVIEAEEVATTNSVNAIVDNSSSSQED